MDMRRYKFLNQQETYEALDRLRDAFLAAKDGNEVNQIIDGLLTHDEKLKIGRRILTAKYLLAGLTIEDISKLLRVGKNTVMHISRRLEKYKECFMLIEKRGEKVKKEFNNKKYRSLGGSKLIFKKKSYTGFRRKDVGR